MNEDNKCEHPLGGWFGECVLYNKDGTYRGTGVGKVVADVTWYNLSDPKQIPHTWAVCQYCLDCECIEGLEAENERESIEAFYGKDFMPISIGQPIFKTYNSDVISLNDNCGFPDELVRRIKNGEKIVPIFLGESAYVEKGTAFLTAKGFE